MLVNTERQIAFRCPICGRLELENLSLFSFSGRKTVAIHCACGYQKLLIQTRDHRHYILKVSCMICDEIHNINWNHDQLWNDAISAIPCTATGQDLGYIGEQESLEDYIVENSKNIESILNDMGFDDFFTNPGVMVQVMAHLHQVADKGHLYCQCGNHEIQIDVFPEKLELHCPQCNSLSIIYAESQEDLELIRNIRQIAMTEKGFTSFNAHRIPGEG
jgi:hypothetical protein